jgi:Pentapeptide repeats (8 copies)
MPTERPVSRPLSVNLDFKRANLSGANFYGAKLDSADLSGANLSGAKLDLAWIMRANSTGANLSNASLFGPVVSSGLDPLQPKRPYSGGPIFRVRVSSRA